MSSPLNFAKVTPNQTLNFAKDFGELISGKLSLNLNWGKFNGRSVDLDAILTTFSSGRPFAATAAVEPTTTIKKAGFFKKLLGGSDEVITEGGRAAQAAGRIPAGMRASYYTRLLGGTEKGQGVIHHGDDTTGASAEGEFIEVDLDLLPADIDELVFSVISYSGHSFADLPFASMALSTGTPQNPGRGLVSMELTEFARSTKAVVLAKIKKNDAGEWEVTGLKREGTSGTIDSAKCLSKGA